jgi:D-glycero-beta-D-manno-heptose 1-phosphate adenylyltransferase
MTTHAHSTDGQWPAKFSTGEQLSQALEKLPRPWVFTNGVFDLLHRGHVSYLEQARHLGASLIVALNSDASARLLGKGPLRPINEECDRVWVVAALESVSLVTLFDEPTPLHLLEQIKPDWYVKGGDYDMALLEETNLVRSWGGRSVAIDLVPGRSSSRIIERIQSLT